MPMPIQFARFMAQVTIQLSISLSALPTVLPLNSNIPANLIPEHHSNKRGRRDLVIFPPYTPSYGFVYWYNAQPWKPASFHIEVDLPEITRSSGRLLIAVGYNINYHNTHFHTHALQYNSVLSHLHGHNGFHFGDGVNTTNPYYYPNWAWLIGKYIAPNLGHALQTNSNTPPYPGEINGVVDNLVWLIRNTVPCFP